MRIGFPGATPADVWGYATRELTLYRLAPSQLVLVPSNIAENMFGTYRFLPAVDATALASANVDSGTGTETTETERLNSIFTLPYLGKGNLKSYMIFVRYYRTYVDTVAGTYYYRMYIQPVAYKYDGTTANLETERLIHEYTRSEAGAEVWTNVGVNAKLRVQNANLAFEGCLGFRLRTTSWGPAGATTGLGFYGLNNPAHWSFMIDLSIEG